MCILYHATHTLIMVVCVCVFSACRFLLDVSDQEMLPSEPLICVLIFMINVVIQDVRTHLCFYD